MTITALSPTRVDIAGGTLDIAPLTQILTHKKTVNIGVSLHARVTVDRSGSGYELESIDQGIKLTGSWTEILHQNRLPLLEKLLAFFWNDELPPLKISVAAKSPAGAGLGGSSCLGIAFASALIQARADVGSPIKLNENELVQRVQDLETALIRVPTGCQDYWGGLRGGINVISYPPGGAHIETLRATEGKDLEDLLMLCYSGVSRASGTNNWAIFKKAFEGDPFTINTLNEIGALSESVASSVKRGDWQEVFRLSAAEWKLRTKLWSDIETHETRSISAAAISAGAMFARICGAGGGGVLAVFAEPSVQARVKRAMEEVGGRPLEGALSWSGTEVKGSL